MGERGTMPSVGDGGSGGAEGESSDAEGGNNDAEEVATPREEATAPVDKVYYRAARRHFHLLRFQWGGSRSFLFLEGT